MHGQSATVHQVSPVSEDSEARRAIETERNLLCDTERELRIKSATCGMNRHTCLELTHFLMVVPSVLHCCRVCIDEGWGATEGLEG